MPDAASASGADVPRPSPFTGLFGSFDVRVERELLPRNESGVLAHDDMIAVVAALRAWEQGGTWNAAYAG